MTTFLYMLETFGGTISLYFKSLGKCNTFDTPMKIGQITENGEMAFDK